MAGYTRNDTSNNIATGNVINAADLDGEFDALVAAFHASTGHTHDGTAANGAPITKIGPAQDLVISTGAITPKTDNTVDLGSSSFEFKDLYIDGTANIDALVADTADINAGTIDGVTLGTNSAVTEAQIDNININGNTISSTDTNGNISLVPNGTGDVILTADTIQVGDSNTDVTVTTNGTGDLIFNTNAGTNSGVIRIYDGANGNIALTPNGTGEVDISKVDIDSGAIDGTAIGANSASTGAFTTLSASSTVTLSGGTANGVLYLNGSKVATSGSALTFDGTNLGLGTTSPNKNGLARAVTLNGSAGQFLGYEIASGDSSLAYFIAQSTTAAYLYTNTNIPIVFGVNNSEQMRLTSTGLGIGTSSPGATLSLLSATGSTNGITLQASGWPYYGRIGMNGASGGEQYWTANYSFASNSVDSASYYSTYIQNSAAQGIVAFGTSSGVNTAPTERMRLDASGNLGIGTNSPGAKLHSSNTSAGSVATQLLLSNADSTDGTGAQLVFSAVAGGTTPTGAITNVRDASGAYSVRFSTFGGGNNTERMRLDSSGNLGLGVTPSAWSGMTPAVEIGGYGSAVASWGSNRNLYLLSNAYYGSGGFTYKTTGGAAYYNVSGETNSHKWFTAPSGTAGNAITFTQAMTLDASGNLAVGTTTTNTGKLIAAVGNSHTFNAEENGSTLGSTNGVLLTNYLSQTTRVAGINLSATAADAGAIIFGTASGGTLTERARITSGGDLLVGTTSQSGKLAVNGVATSAPLVTFYSSTAGDVGQPGLLIGKQDNDTTTSQIILRASILSTGAGAGQINMNGANTLAFGTYSDARLKENITDLPSQLANIMALRPVEFDYIESEGGGHQIGFIAQEMQQVYPDAVGEREDGMLTVSAWSKTEARLVKAIQEQQALITSLTARVALLEGN